MAKYARMMKVDDCDFIQIIDKVSQKHQGKLSRKSDDHSELLLDWYDWFVSVEMVKNRTGDWYFGVVALKNTPKSVIQDGSCSDITKEDLDYSFNQTEEFPGYDIRIYTSGCYFFNSTTEEWDGIGITVIMNMMICSISLCVISSLGQDRWKQLSIIL